MRQSSQLVIRTWGGAGIREAMGPYHHSRKIVEYGVALTMIVNQSPFRRPGFFIRPCPNTGLTQNHRNGGPYKRPPLLVVRKTIETVDQNTPSAMFGGLMNTLRPIFRFGHAMPLSPLSITGITRDSSFHGHTFDSCRGHFYVHASFHPTIQNEAEHLEHSICEPECLKYSFGKRDKSGGKSMVPHKRPDPEWKDTLRSLKGCSTYRPGRRSKWGV